MESWEGILVLCKQGVAGSIPATSTILSECKRLADWFLIYFPAARELCKIGLIGATVHDHLEVQATQKHRGRF